jgi:uncharacterized protein YecT (DUF1311 family)
MKPIKSKYYILLFVMFFVHKNVIAQNDGPVEVTEEILKKIKLDVDIQTKEFVSTIDTNDYSASFRQFMTDTFKVERLAAGMLDYDYSTYGINNALDQMLKGYDGLLNKYYQQLMSKLSVSDKEVLKESQRNWLAYRDAELKLLGVLIKEEYSGGGSIQSNLLGASYAERIIKRVVELFQMYDSIIMK